MPLEHRYEITRSDGHAPSSLDGARRPICHAIDRLTVATIELQRIRRRMVTQSLPIEEVQQELSEAERSLFELGALLITIRDGNN